MTFDMYSQPGCQPCLATERKAVKHGIELNVTNIREDAGAVEFIKGLGYNGTPVVVIRDEAGEIVDHWTGFSPDRIAQYAAA